jgi:hypothetical protein
MPVRNTELFYARSIIEIGYLRFDKIINKQYDTAALLQQAGFRITVGKIFCLLRLEVGRRYANESLPGVL